MKKLNTIFLLILFIILILGGIYIKYTWDTNLNRKSELAIQKARIAESMFPVDILSKLDLNETDLEKQEYQQSKNNLIDLVKLDETIAFAYIYKKINDKIFFVMDSEPVDSEDYSPPGQEYTEAHPQDFQPFIDGQSFITEIQTDRWGKWISVYVPIIDMGSSEVEAVFGIDYPADHWKDSVIRQSLMSFFIVLLLLFLLFIFYLIIKRNLETKEREKNFRIFFDTIDDIIVVGDREGKIIYTNKACSLKLGYSEQELKKMNIIDINQKDKREEFEKIFNDMINGEINNCPLPLEKKDGALLPVETRIWFAKWGGIDCIYGISKDIGQEQELLQKFNKIFDINPAFMAVSSYPDRILTDVNKTFLDKMGYKKEEIIGKTSKELGIFVQSENLEHINKELIEVGYIHDVFVKLKAKNGDIIEGLFSGDIIENQGKKYFLTVFIDQTERMKAVELMERTLKDSEKLNKLMIGRELEMIELKKELTKLKNQINL